MTAGETGICVDAEAIAKRALAVGRGSGLLQPIREFLSSWLCGSTLPTSLKIDGDRAAKALVKLAQQMDRPARDGDCFLDQGRLKVLLPQAGQRLNIVKTVWLWGISVGAGEWKRLKLCLDQIDPPTPTANWAAIETILGAQTTHFSERKRNRSHNIRLAARRLERAWILPGHILSFNQTVGRRTARAGFRVAPILVKGEYSHDFGGGVCQVAGTLYNAALKAGLKVVERHRHSRSVDYLPVGLDATVSFGRLDLKILNPHQDPVLVKTRVGRGSLTIFILGRKRDESFFLVRDLRRFQWSVTNGQESTAVLPRRSGWYVRVWRLRRVGKQLVGREVVTDDFYPSAEETVAPVRPILSPRPTPAVRPATHSPQGAPTVRSDAAALTQQARTEGSGGSSGSTEDSPVQP